MPVNFEMFATSSARVDDVWGIVGDPARLPEWTDADQVEAPPEVVEGAQITTVADGTAHTWTVVTVGKQIWEARTTIAAGTLGLGVRVVADRQGSRLILAGALEPSGSTLLARALTVPRLRGRCDRWTARAISLAKGAR